MRRRLAGRIKRGLDAIKAAQVIAQLGPKDAANMLERGGKGSGAWWAAKPSANLVWMGNRHFLIALKRRLRQPVLAEGCVCAHKHQTGKKIGQTCSNPLDKYGDHAVKCMVGPYRNIWHNDVKLYIAETLRRAGAFVEVEMFAPHLYKWKKDGELREAVLDVAWRWPTRTAWTYVDVTVRSTPSVGAPKAARDPWDATDKRRVL
jgi:hypothetical protein